MSDNVRQKILSYILNDSIPAHIAKGAWSGFTFPGDVLSGAASPDDIGRATDAASLMAGGLSNVGKAGKAATNLASRSPRMYDPPVQKPRPFEADYPAGAVADDAGKLVSDIDGRELSARYVVGRRDVSGPDVALPPEALDEITKARTGAPIRYSAPGAPDLGRDMGRAVFGRSGKPDYVAVSRALKEPQRTRVAQHEVAHFVDETADNIPVHGLSRELRTVYNDLNNPQGYGKPFGPENNGYKGPDIDRELVADSIRAYMADPNYLKTVAPETAARIRAQVNPNPKLKDLIQFNTVAPLAPAAAAGLHDWLKSRREDERFGEFYKAGRGA